MRPWPFDTVLIANRGEIALRILRSVQAQGLRAVVVHHALDRLSPAVALQSSAASLSLFTGSLPRYTISGSEVVRLSAVQAMVEGDPERVAQVIRRWVRDSD